MNTFYLRVISSNKVFFDDKVTKFVLPLEDGEMAVLPHHENMIIATSIGEIRIDTPDGKKILGVVGKERLRQKESLKEYKQTEASLSRALMRLKVTGRDL